MQNLEQIRAAKALEAVNGKKFVRSDVAGFPALIMQNGLLAALAYAAEDGKTTRAGLRFACDQTAEHLANKVHGIDVLAGKKSAKEVISALSTATSLDLQRATSEALAFFSYLKRFASKD